MVSKGEIARKIQFQIHKVRKAKLLGQLKPAMADMYLEALKRALTRAQYK